MALVSPGPDAASLTLPPLSQFGYLASSLSLAEELDAQVKIIDFVHTCRAEGFAIDSLHLSSGWCQGWWGEFRSIRIYDSYCVLFGRRSHG